MKKKITIALLGIVGAVCLSCSFGLLNNEYSVQADDEQTQGVEFTQTKYKISDDGEKMLLVTAINNIDNVYEIGYEFENYTVTDSDVTVNNKYYSTLTTDTTESAETIFGADYADWKLLIWEVANEEGVSFTAYALEGEWDGGNLTIPETEQKSTGTMRNNNRWTITFDTDGGSTIDPLTVAEGTSASGLATLKTEKSGYDFLGWKLVLGDGTLMDIPADATVTSNITVKAVWEQQITELDKTVDLFLDSADGDMTIDVAADLGLNTAVSTDTVYTATVAGTETTIPCTATAMGVTLGLTADMYGEKTILLTVGEQKYQFNVVVITKVITTAEQLASFTTLGTVTDYQTLSNQSQWFSGTDTYWKQYGYFVLGNNIDFSGNTLQYRFIKSLESNYPALDQATGGLNGVFDGRGYTISGGTYKYTNWKYHYLCRYCGVRRLK